MSAMNAFVALLRGINVGGRSKIPMTELKSALSALGLEDVATSTPAELGVIAESNPFLTGEGDLSKLHVVFLNRPPAASAVAQLDPGRSPPDEFKVSGREIYLHLPNKLLALTRH